MRWVEQYTYTNRIRNLHPAYKVCISFLIVLVCLATTNIVVPLLALICICFLLLIWAKIPLIVFLKMLLSEGWFLVMAVVSIAVSVTITPLPHALHIGFLWFSVSPKSFDMSLRLLMRALSCAAALNFLTLTTSITDLIYLARQLRAPEFLLDLITFMYRFIFVLYNSLEQMLMAQQVRLGFSNFRRSMHSLAYIAAQLFIEALRRSRRLDMALQGRGWDGTLRVLNQKYEHPSIFRYAATLLLRL